MERITKKLFEELEMMIGYIELNYDDAGDYKKLIKADIKTCICLLEKWQD
jgi:hypothetical protein